MSLLSFVVVVVVVFQDYGIYVVVRLIKQIKFSKHDNVTEL